MPYRTRTGRVWHETLGCHGATTQCGAGEGGLRPCRSCGSAAKAERRARRAGEAAGAQGAAAGDGMGGAAGGWARIAAEFARVAASTEVTSDSLPPHWHESRQSLPGSTVDRAMGMLGISSMSGLAGWAAGADDEGHRAVASLVGEGDMLGALALAVAIGSASDPSQVTGDGGYAVMPAAQRIDVVEALAAAGVPEPVELKLPGGMALVCSRAGDAIDVSRKPGEMGPADIALAWSCVRRSANGPYELAHYDQIACYVSGYMGGTLDMWDAYDGFLAELRGTVYDTRDMSIVSSPYYKFRNLNECDAYSEANVRAAIDANGGRMVATEKLDGSLIQLRYVEAEDHEGGAWEQGMLITTSNTLDGSATAPGNSHIQAARERHVLCDDPRYRDLARAYPGKTLMFEMIEPDVDPHVVAYDESRHGLWLTGMRDVATGRLSTHEEVAAAAEAHGIPHPAVIATNLDECIRVTREGKGADMEGMVVDIDGWLIKMKLDDFLTISRIYHALDESRGFRDILRLAHEGTLDDLLGRLPAPSRAQASSIVARAFSYQERMAATIDSLMARAPDSAADRKEFAKWVSRQRIPREWKGYLFAVADGQRPLYYADRVGKETHYVRQNEFARREEVLAAWLAQQGQQQP